ncbi:hypothetical protein TWF481_010764 [Arthrobotrys musiformis]|uniref:Glycoside hydrolase 131 catalytic N-terminal domain-containing protein n=1 Tax=Arthrobotrys musiformis TaxID=47236 RepID=A0AAV9W336_9PEZI
MPSLITLLPFLAAANALVPAPRPRAAGNAVALGTSADVYVHNDLWNKSLTVSTIGTKHLRVQPPAAINIPGGKTEKFPVQADGQGQGRIELKAKPHGTISESKFSIDLGSSPYKTGISQDVTPFKGHEYASFVAPLESQIAGHDFDLHLLTGRGISATELALAQSKLDGAIQTVVKLFQGNEFYILNTNVTGVYDTYKADIKINYLELNKGPDGGHIFKAIFTGDYEYQMTVTKDGASKTLGHKETGSSTFITGDVKIGSLIEFTAKTYQVSVGDVKFTGEHFPEFSNAAWPEYSKDAALYSAVINTSDNQRSRYCFNHNIENYNILLSLSTGIAARSEVSKEFTFFQNGFELVF